MEFTVIVPFLQLCRKILYEIEGDLTSGTFVLIVNSKMSLSMLKGGYKIMKDR